MKKLTPLILGITLLFSISCSKDDDKNNEPPLAERCENTTDEIISALETFSANPSVSTCEAYKDVLLDYIDNCPTYQFYDESYEAAVQSIDCSLYDIQP